MNPGYRFAGALPVDELALEELKGEQDADNPHVGDTPGSRALDQSTDSSRLELATIERRLVDEEPEQRPAFASEIGRVASEPADRCYLRLHAMPKCSEACGDLYSYLRRSRRRAVIRRRDTRKLGMRPYKESLQETVTVEVRREWYGRSRRTRNRRTDLWPENDLQKASVTVCCGSEAARRAQPAGLHRREVRTRAPLRRVRAVQLQRMESMRLEELVVQAPCAIQMRSPDERPIDGRRATYRSQRREARRRR